MRRKLRTALLLLGFASRLPAGEVRSISCQTPAELNKWVEARSAGGSGHFEAGSALSECLVTDDDQFFRVMLVQREIFDGWLNGLASHTFTVFEASQRPRIEELKKRMTDIANRRSTEPSYGSLARSLAEQLAKTTVDELPPALVVVEGAQDVRFARPQPAKSPPADIARDFPGAVVFGADGSVAGLSAQDRLPVSYRVRVKYPAADLLAEVRGRLEKAGWEPLPMDWLKSKPSSHSAGWRFYPDYTAPKGVFSWIGQWRNQAGDLVDYAFSYETALPEPGAQAASPDNEELRVRALLVFRRLVPIDSLPPSLVVVEGARDVNAWQDRDRASDKLGVRYFVRAPYPATEVLANVAERLGKQGWDPMPTEGPDSGTPTDSPGWRSSLDHYKRPTMELFRWKGQWRNKAGDQALYSLTYESGLSAPGARASEPDNAELYVEAILRSKPATQAAPVGKPREGRFYTSPSGSFRVRVQGSLGDARTSEKAPRPGDWRVTFEDDLCSMFMLEERSGGLKGDSLDDWVDRNLIARMQASKIELKDRRSVSTERGPAVLLRILQPEASPCQRSVSKDGKRHMEKIDLDAGMYVLYTGNRVYVFLYGISADDKTTSLFTGSVDEVLLRFVEDFEVLKPAPRPKTSTSRP